MYVMVGLLLGFHLTVFVVVIFQHLMHLTARTVFFPTIRHNNIHDFTASLLSGVCHYFKIEHYLQPLSGENLRHRTAVCDEDARLDIHVAGIWEGITINIHFLMFVCLIPLLYLIGHLL